MKSRLKYFTKVIQQIRGLISWVWEYMVLRSNKRWHESQRSILQLIPFVKLTTWEQQDIYFELPSCCFYFKIKDVLSNFEVS